MNNIYMDDWNKVMLQLPQNLIANSMELIRQAIPYHDDSRYEKLKSILHSWLLPLGYYETICYISGSQAIEKAILITKEKYACHVLFKMKGVYHGLNIQQWEDEETTYTDLVLQFIEIQKDGLPDLSCLLAEENAIILLEPMLLYALYGERTNEILLLVEKIAAERKHIIIADEVRSGIFKTGTFLLSEQVGKFHPHIVCFSKGLGLGVAVSAACFQEKHFTSQWLKPFDTGKSNLTLSALALQRAVDFLQYVKDTSDLFFDECRKIEAAIKKEIAIHFSNKTYITTHTVGCICIFNFDGSIRQSKLRAIRMTLLSSGVIIRHFEDHLLFLNFPIDIDIEQISTALHKISDVLDVILL